MKEQIQSVEVCQDLLLLLNGMYAMNGILANIACCISIRMLNGKCTGTIY